MNDGLRKRPAAAAENPADATARGSAPPPEGRPRVTIAGGGLAGMTTALRLAEQGYGVKLYEQKSMLGGNFGSRTIASGVTLDVYPHMFVSWSHNFWQLVADIGVSREERFASFENVKQLAPGEFPHFTEMLIGFGPREVLENLQSGPLPAADMIIFGYASIDLLAERAMPTVRLQDMSMRGFLNARPYTTTGAIEAYETFISRVWAIPSYLVSAHDCSTYLDYCYGAGQPESWLARGPASREVVEPLEERMRRAGVEIECGVEVTEVIRRGERASEVVLRHTTFDPHRYRWVGVGEPWTEPVDELVLALPAPTLARLVRSGPPGHRVIDLEEGLAQLSRLQTQAMPILHLFLDRELEGLPPEPVGLLDSDLNLAFTAISRTWDQEPVFDGRSVLVVSCSEPDGLAGPHPTDNGFQVLQQLSRYLDFDPGTGWGESPHIDWTFTRFDENYDAQLSLDAVGTDEWRPPASAARIDNLWFAGDLCQQEIGLSNIESAVVSGLQVVNGIVERRGFGTPLEIVMPKTRPGPEYLFWRGALLPVAAAAWALSQGEALGLGREGGPTGGSGGGFFGENFGAGIESLRRSLGEIGAGFGASGGAGDAPANGGASSQDGDSLLSYLLTPGLPARRQRRES